MSAKEERLEFRASAAMKHALLDLRPMLDAKTLSEVIRKMLERLIDNLDAGNLWGAIPTLKEIALHLDRIACALQRCLLDGSSPHENLTDLSQRVDHVRALLGALMGSRSRESRLDR